MSKNPYHWQMKICPQLSAATIGRKTPPGIVKVNGADEGEPVMMCQGSRCMSFVPMADPDGMPRGNGTCATALLASTVAQYASAVMEEQGETSAEIAESQNIKAAIAAQSEPT